MGGSGDAPEKTAAQVALETRQRRELNEEIAASERRLKAVARGKLGKRSLLGQPMQPVAAPSAPSGPTNSIIPRSERENEGRQSRPRTKKGSTKDTRRGR